MNQYEDDEETFDIPTSKTNAELQQKKNPDQTANNIQTTIFDFTYNFSWGLLFLIFRHYNDQSCDIINAWSLAAEIFLFFMAGFKLLIEIPILYYNRGSQQNQLIDAVQFVELFLNILILVGLTYAYLQHEDCMHLRMFILIYLIVSYFILFIWILIIIYSFCNKGKILRNS
ncbi:unnamed protein product [Paramecium sonneborni]|uniref:Transmembrane protein n=1 Tax=Paramecium sonneborni TaxID=65129 RepID=A0A8S1NNX4_9CILI|nr:unnamed protein product [Paramecium sonneborni]